MRSPANVLESLFLVEVFRKGVVDEDMWDSNQHCILTGEIFAEISWSLLSVEKGWEKTELHDSHPWKCLTTSFSLLLKKIVNCSFY